jgi:Putative auto-transporter adhesin, head GIN domain
MKKGILLILLIISGFVSNGQNVVYDENAEVRVVESFNSIEVSGAVFLYLSQGSVQGVAISAGEAKYNSKIKTEVKNGVLHISVEGGVWNGFNWTNRKLRAYVTAVNLNRLEVSGASYASISGALKSDDLKMDISGASEVKGIINASKLNLDISGASVARLSGSVKDALIDASGACKVNSYDLSIETCRASSSGASNIKVTVTGELNADATGGSNIYYKGPGIGKVLNTSAGASIKNRSGSDD